VPETCRQRLTVAAAQARPLVIVIGTTIWISVKDIANEGHGGCHQGQLLGREARME